MNSKILIIISETLLRAEHLQVECLWVDNAKNNFSVGWLARVFSRVLSVASQKQPNGLLRSKT